MAELQMISTARLQTAVRVSGDPDGIPLLLVHGNVSSSRFFDELLRLLPPLWYVLAPDLRGFGDSQRLPVDASRGVADYSDDLHALVETVGLAGTPFHLLGWSLGGGVAMQYAIDHPQQIVSLTLVAPVSPFGFGGTKGAEGTPCFPDYAGSGGGTANPEFVRRLANRDAGQDSPFSPRNVMNAFYFKPSFAMEEARENVYVAAMLQTAVGEGNYPGDLTPSENWPTVAPGKRGNNNAVAPGHFNSAAIADINPQPPILWVRGDSDQIVSDTSLFDFGFLGQIGAVPGWPGAEIFPPQPMLAQTRAVLDRYTANGGHYEEEVIENAGHAPFIEQPEAFLEAFVGFVRRNS
ncbi:MAG: alpha/beta hydrolase [Chloroflexi bacterium]|nr:MAG: alpha/beta hydrolase [Chloroflexota bacterium]